MSVKSSKPRKQRKWRATLPLHERKSLVSASLSKELRSKYHRRSLSVRKGDTVKVLRGQFKGVSGIVLGVDLKQGRLLIEGVTVKKADGTDVERALAASNVVITDVFLEDKERRVLLERNVK